MIRKSIKAICKTPELIENYDLAMADTEHVWECHHRLQTYKRNKKTNTWELRDEAISVQDLLAFGLYYDRPATELIFLTSSEHTRLHNLTKGCRHYDSTERSEKISKATKSRPPYVRTAEHRKLMGERKKGVGLGREPWNKGLHTEGRPQTENEKAKRKETFRLISEAYKQDNKGLSWNEFQKYYRENR